MYPQVTVLGIHPMSVTAEVMSNAILQYGLDDETPDGVRDLVERILHDYSRTYLIEMTIDGREAIVADLPFTQRKQDVPESDWQAPWLERYLYPNGREVVSEGSPPEDATRVRVAFYLHDLDPAQPLASPWGDIKMPQPTPMPARLMQIAPYEVVD